MATLTVNPTTNREGYILGYGSVRAVDTTRDEVDVGKSKWGSTVYEWRGYLGFDTSSIGAGATVTSATLDIYVWRSGGVNSNFQFYCGQNKFSTPLAKADWDDYLTMTLFATKSTSGISTSKSAPTHWSIPVNTTCVATTGNTDITMRLSSTPSVSGEYYFLNMHSVDSSSTGYWPVLTVDYTTGGVTRRRVFHAVVQS